MCTSQQTYYRVQLFLHRANYRITGPFHLETCYLYLGTTDQAGKPTGALSPTNSNPLGRAGPCQALPGAARCPRGLPLPARVTSAPQGHLATGSLPSIPPIPAAPEALPTMPGRRAAPAAQGSRALPPTARRAPHAAAARSSRLMAAMAGAGSGAGPAGGREARQAPF